MTAKDVTHGSFTLERTYPASAARVFAAYTDAKARYRWLIASDGWTIHDYAPAAATEPGAVEFSRFSPPGADVVITNHTTFLDVTPTERVILAYAMTIAGAPLSASLLTAVFHAEGPAATRLVLIEQGAYLDGNVAGREEGMGTLLEALGREIEGVPAG